MDSWDREARIEQLRRENDEALARIEERQAAREADPYSEQDELFADAEPVGAALVERQAAGNGLLYRTHETPLPRVLQPDAGASDGLDQQTFARALGETIAHERTRERRERDQELAARDRKLADLQSENLELKSPVRDVLAKLQATDEKVRNFLIDLERERRERGELELKMADLRGRVAGLVRDFSYG